MKVDLEGLVWSSLAFGLALVPSGCAEDRADPEGDGDGDADADIDGDGDGDSDADGPLAIDGPCPDETRVGLFVVEAQSVFGLVDGTVADAVVPASILTEVRAEGDCRLLRRSNPFCDPPCDPGLTCAWDGSCIPFPTGQDVGVVTVRGLIDPVRMEPLQPGNRYSFTDLPNPPFEPGAEIRLRASGGLALDGRGFAPVAPADELWRIERGQALAVGWDAPAGADAPTRVRLDIDIDQHGNTPLRVVCDFPDTGTAELPAALVDALLDAGVSGYPNGRLTRRTADSTADREACVELQVSSPRSVDVLVGGHVACDGPEDCPEGARCDIETNTCR